MTSPKQLRAQADRLRRQAKTAADRAAVLGLMAEARDQEAAALEALRPVPKPRNMGRMSDAATAGETRRRVKIGKTRTKGRPRPPVLDAIYDAGLTPASAAELVGTTRDIIKQSWAKGDQFREARPEWKRKLAARGVPEHIWPTTKG